MRQALLLVVLLGAALSMAAAAAVAAAGGAKAAANNKAAAAAAPAAPRFQQSAAKGKARMTLGARAAAAAAAGGRVGATSQAKVKGGEWWVQDVPWFLPPPPEWGPLPPTMYTSYFHRPRYPTLSTANYYPLYSKTDEYDAHLPASMSRRATLTQQMVYDNYVTNHYAHTHFSPTGNPNLLISNPSMYGNSAAFGGLGEAHARVLSAQSTNNYFPLFSRTHDFYTSPGQTFSPHFASTGVSFLEEGAALRKHKLARGKQQQQQQQQEEVDEYGVPPPPMFAPPASYQLVGGGALHVQPTTSVSAPFLSSTRVSYRSSSSSEELETDD